MMGDSGGRRMVAGRRSDTDAGGCHTNVSPWKPRLTRSAASTT